MDGRDIAEAGKPCPLHCGRCLRDGTHRPDLYVFLCDACGHVELTVTLFGANRTTVTMNELPYLRAHTRQSSVVFRFDGTTNWKEIVEAHRSTPFQRKTTRLLEEIGRLSDAPGRWVRVDPVLM